MILRGLLNRVERAMAILDASDSGMVEHGLLGGSRV
jgi:hypothetical protein